MSASWEIREGDCCTLMAAMPEASVDAIVCDPPYGLEFMGRDWDRLGRKMQEWHERWAREALRVLKPGGFLLAAGGTRTYHRLVCAVEDAGFEIRDRVLSLGNELGSELDWLYGSGFPKSLDVSKAIDKAAGAERTGNQWATVSDDGRLHGGGVGRNARCSTCGKLRFDHDRCLCPRDDGPQTANAERWGGWGTALKPAHEPIVVARKPLAGTVAGNVLAHGTGALNIDGCRIGSAKGSPSQRHRELARRTGNAPGRPGEYRDTLEDRTSPERYMESRPGEQIGRWPANVVLAHAEGCVLVGERRVSSDGHFPATRGASGYGSAEPQSNGGGLKGQDGLEERHLAGEVVQAWECVPGCAVRMLDEQSGVLTSGANPTRRGSDKFRTAYGEFAGQRECDPARGVDVGGASRFFYTAKASTAERGPDNKHPTVKPVDLMCWLVRLVTPPGGIVLDPFTGSGTTGIAAMREGFSFIGLEREPEYVTLARRRIVDDAPLLNAAAEAVA